MVILAKATFPPYSIRLPMILNGPVPDRRTFSLMPVSTKGNNKLENFSGLLMRTKSFPNSSRENLLQKAIRWYVSVIGMQNRRRQVSLIPVTGLWHFISEMDKYVSIENTMTHMVKQMLPKYKTDSLQLKIRPDKSGRFFYVVLVPA